ncbi:MAG TPA: TonB-dependent receptor [Calditrichia bacterium]|nr:TonB-dependent receptor [Calditrichota bacterium]HQU71165.1 TonB-dependent receptor [Calditrichia bacterium]HQV30751.1 TonB-dependent receptor [Calditrichia bacterium]
MHRIKFLLLALLLMLPALQVFGQGTGIVTGIISDNADQSPLIAANVYIEGTSLGAATDVDGAYYIPGVPAGSYIIVVKYIGYKEIKAPLEVVAGKRNVQNFSLDYAAVEGEVVEVTAQAQGQIEAINRQLSSNTIKNVVSSDRIQEVPDANAAESVGRLPGISVVRSGGEGQKVTIRGLSPKYNVMMVNGVRMQSNDRNDRSVDLNMIAPNVLSGIEVTKALTADMDADAVGGTVNLLIGKARKGFYRNFSVEGGYGSLENTYGNFKASGFLSNRYMEDKFGVQLSGFFDKYDRSSDVLTSAYYTDEEEITEDGLIPIYLSNVTISDKVTDRRRVGGGLVLDYKFSNGSLIMNNFLSTLHQEQIEQQNYFTTAYDWRGFAADRESDNTVLSNALQGEFEFFNRLGMDFSLSNSVSKQRNPGDLRMDIRTRSGGTQGLTSTETDLITKSPTRFLNSVTVLREGKISTGTSTLERQVDETSRSAVLNFKLPFTLTNFLAGSFKMGGKFERNKRENDETMWVIDTDRGGLAGDFNALLRDSLWTDLGISTQDNGLLAGLFEDPGYDVGDFLSGKENVNGSLFFNKVSIDKMRHMEKLAKESGYYLPAPLESSQYDYNYTRDFSSFYFMPEFNLGKYVTFIPGFRYESFSYDYTADSTYVFGRLTTPGEDYFDNKTINWDVTKDNNWFPQIHLRIKPLDFLDLRLASTRSIIYPDYRAVSPYLFVDAYAAPVMRLGNPYLKPALTQNFDAYGSVYANKVGLFTAGFFYKEIDNLIVPIEYYTKDNTKINERFPLLQTGDPTRIFTWTNLEEQSTVKGFELDWQTHFWYLPSFLSGFVFNINYTHIKSETRYPYYYTKRSGNFPFYTYTTVDTIRSGRLIDQPDDILNTTLGYDVGGFSARLSFLFQDNVFRSANPTYDELDGYTDAYYRWDFTAFQRFPGVEGLQIFLNLNNISNRPDRQFTSVLEKLSAVEYYGAIAALGFRYTY